MSRSEFRCLEVLERSGCGSLSEYELYRACVGMANNGLQRPEEPRLEQEYRRFLDIRRKLKARKFEEAKAMLVHPVPAMPVLRGDRCFLLGILADRTGRQSEAVKHYEEAAKIYSACQDYHREIRALINAKICQSDLSSYFAGGLFALEQRAQREGCHDLVGIIQKGRAGELLSAGRFTEAVASSEAAISSFQKDGCPEDLAVARLTAALARLMIGDAKAAHEHFSAVSLSGGKIDPYVDAYNALLAGKIPALPEGHPIENTPWTIQNLRPSSISGKILRRLQEGPATADQLIEFTWGKAAIHPSYRNRLFVALNKLKKSAHIGIHFDGELYKVA